MGIHENIKKIKEKIAQVVSKVNRSPDEICIVAATKGRDIKEIKEAIDSGIRIIGENRWQEAREKISSLKDENIEWHFIGHLQKNKVKYVVENFDMIQSVDSQELIEEISKRATRANKLIDVLIEVNISREPQKYGLPPEKTVEFIRKNANLPGVKIRGIMTIAPWFGDERVRPFFIEAKKLFDAIKEENIEGVELTYLSMGMSDDFWIAIEEGSNMVRLGRAIFGERRV